jgi:hypothetical protein
LGFTLLPVLLPASITCYPFRAMYDFLSELLRWSACSRRSPVTVFRRKVPRPVGRLVPRKASLLVPAPFKWTSSLHTTSGLLAPGAPRGQGRGSSRFYPPDCYQLSQAGTSSLLRIHLPPCTASFDLESPLESHYPLTTRDDTRLPQLLRTPCELPHPLSLHGSDQEWGFALFCTLTHPLSRIRFTCAVCSSLPIASFRPYRYQ